MIAILRHYGYSFIFLVVFAENLGLPVPSYPVILVGAGLAAELHFRVYGLLAISVVAALIADIIWYALGRVRGRPILRKLCSLSLSPDSCVSRTEDLYKRLGLKSLLVAKFIPGLNTVGPPLAGMLRTSPLRFTLFDFGGAALWSGSALLLGLAFREQVVEFIDWLSAFGRTSILILLVLLAGWILMKFVQRRRFYRRLERSRISAEDLKKRLEQGEEIVVVDLRSDLTYESDATKIPGAIHIPPGEFEARYKEIPPGRPIVMYCT